MSITANQGPYVAFLDPTNPESAPSCFLEGTALLDPRPFYTYDPGQNFGAMTAAIGQGSFQTLAAVPSVKSAVNIAVAANAVLNTPMTLVSTSGAGVTVGVSITNALTGLVVTGLLALDGSATLQPFGSAATIQLWNPVNLLSRAVTITGVAAGIGGNFLISGYDIYGFPMSQLVAVPAGVATTATLKAFKYIASVTPQFADAHTYSVGTADVFGFPLASQALWVDTMINWNGANIAANTGYLAAVTTTATTATGDVRGTYAVQSASDGTKALILMQTPQLVNLSLANGPNGGPASGLFGVTQI
jgi:hypothetical protein